MLSVQEEKIRKIFTSAKSFAVVSSDQATEEILLAKEALGAAIRNLGLSVHSFPEKERGFAGKWLSILPVANNNSSIFLTSILIPKNKTEVQEISYTEDARYVSININASEEISKENIVFKNLPTKIDAVFCFSSSGQEQLTDELTGKLSKKITLPEAENIITLASDSSGETIAEKTFNIIRTIESSGDFSINKFPVPTLILASLLVETDQFQKNISGESLNLAASLIKLGADKEKIIGLIDDKNPSFARLLGRALARSHLNESPKSMWTFVSGRDLEKTEHEPNPALFGKIMKKIKNLLEPCPVFVLIWQSKQEVWAMISLNSSGGELEEKIRSALSAKKDSPDGGGNLVSGPYKNFSEAELKIQGALKDAV